MTSSWAAHWNLEEPRRRTPDLLANRVAGETGPRFPPQRMIDRCSNADWTNVRLPFQREGSIIRVRGKVRLTPIIGSGEAADIGASRRPSQSKPALSGTYPCPSRLGQTWIGSRPLRYAGGFRVKALESPVSPGDAAPEMNRAGVRPQGSFRGGARPGSGGSCTP